MGLCPKDAAKRNDRNNGFFQLQMRESQSYLNINIFIYIYIYVFIFIYIYCIPSPHCTKTLRLKCLCLNLMFMCFCFPVAWYPLCICPCYAPTVRNIKGAMCGFTLQTCFNMIKRAETCDNRCSNLPAKPVETCLLHLFFQCCCLFSDWFWFWYREFELAVASGFAGFIHVSVCSFGGDSLGTLIY